MFEDNNAEIILKRTNEPGAFAKQTFFYYKEFYQVNIQNDFSTQTNSGDCYQLYYVTRGSLFMTLGQSIFTLSKNDLLMVKKHISIKMSTSNCEFYTLSFDGKLAPDYMGNLVDSDDNGRSIADFSNIVMFFVRLKELSMYDLQNDAYVSLNIEAILVEVYSRKYYGNQVDAPQSYAIIQALFYIEQNVGGKITLKDLSEFVGYSVYHFSRLFKKEVGMPPYEYITNFRLGLAKHLLITTKKQIKDIALECGYKNEINFYSLFRKNEHMSPRKYRIKSN